jgi:hypothetical protein
MSQPATTTTTSKEASGHTPETYRDSKAESVETSTAAEEGKEKEKENLQLKDEPGAKWKNKETHEIPYK